MRPIVKKRSECIVGQDGDGATMPRRGIALR